MINYKEFENREIDRFLTKFYDLSATSSILTNLDHNNFPSVRSATKQGIEEGVVNYLKENDPNIPTVYMANLHQFYFDENVKVSVQKHVEKLKLGLENIDHYSEDVWQQYGLFMYNESRDAFLNQFKDHSEKKD